MSNIMYSFFSFVCLIIISILLIRTVRSNDGHALSKIFIYMLVAAMLLCGIDSIWGYLDSTPGIHIKKYYSTLMTTVSFLIHLGTGIVSFVWYIYADIYSKLSLRKNYSVKIITAIPVVIIFLFLSINFFNGCVFYIDEEQFYHSGKYRLVIFSLQYFYYLLAAVKMISAFFKTKNLFLRKRIFAVIFFVIIPFVTGILQFKYLYIPFLSCGLMLSVLIIYSFNVTRDSERYLVLKKENENQEKLTENKQVIEALSNSFVSMHLFDIKKNTYKTVLSNERIEELKTGIENADNEVKNIMRSVTVNDYQLIMEAFSDVPSLSERLKNQQLLSQEFLTDKYGWCRASWIPVSYDEKGFVKEALHTIQRIDEQKNKELDYQKRLQNALQNQNEIFAEMLKMQSSGVIATEFDKTVLLLNDVAASIFGYTKQNRFDGNIARIINKAVSNEKEKILEELQKIKENGGSYSFEFEINNSDKNIHLLGTSKQVMLSSGKKILVTTLTDITKKKLMEKELIHLSEIDSLTNLNNRGSGEKKIRYLLENDKSGMLGIIDSDKFKSVNDTYGHAVGDRVIVEIAKALNTAFRERDIVMRLGGDEFAFFAVGITTEEVGRRCINRFFSEIEKINIEELGERKITVSVGAIICNEETKKTFDEYYRKADSVMYISKKREGNSFEFYQN